jgi:hypothetical protein
MSSKAYAILRVQRLKTAADLDGATRHGKREDTGTHFDGDRTQYNRHWSACRVIDPVDWRVGVEDAVKRVNAVTRQGATLAAEFLVAASPSYFDPPEGTDHLFNMARVNEWSEATMAAFYSRFGKAVVAARLDLDEGSPHMAICVLPTYVKVTKHKKEIVVSYRQVFSGNNKAEARMKLSELQDWYAEEMSHLGLERGLPARETRRGHLTHQQYARKKLQEDRSRAEALAEAREYADRLRQAIEAMSDKAERQKIAEELAAEMAAEIASMLDEAKKLHEFLSTAASLLAKYHPTDPMVEVIASKAPAFERAQAEMTRIEDTLADYDQVGTARRP